MRSEGGGDVEKSTDRVENFLRMNESEKLDVRRASSMGGSAATSALCHDAIGLTNSLPRILQLF